MILKYLKSELNPQGIPYSELKKGRYIVVDIPICHEKGVVEVEGVISKEDSSSRYYKKISPWLLQNEHHGLCFSSRFFLL